MHDDPGTQVVHGSQSQRKYCQLGMGTDSQSPGWLKLTVQAGSTSPCFLPKNSWACFLAFSCDFGAVPCILDVSDASTSPRCSHHFLVMQVHIRQCSPLPGSDTSMPGATRLHHLWVTPTLFRHTFGLGVQLRVWFRGRPAHELSRAFQVYDHLYCQLRREKATEIDTHSEIWTNPECSLVVVWLNGRRSALWVEARLALAFPAP